jgi:anti-sigma factor RsiW
MLPISETELNAYVDGELFPERQALVEAWLAGDPAQAPKMGIKGGAQ